MREDRRNARNLYYVVLFAKDQYVILSGVEPVIEDLGVSLQEQRTKAFLFFFLELLVGRAPRSGVKNGNRKEIIQCKYVFKNILSFKFSSKSFKNDREEKVGAHLVYIQIKKK